MTFVNAKPQTVKGHTQKKRKDLGHTSVAKFCRFFRLVFEVLLREREPEPEPEAGRGSHWC